MDPRASPILDTDTRLLGGGGLSASYAGVLQSRESWLIVGNAGYSSPSMGSSLLPPRNHPFLAVSLDWNILDLGGTVSSRNWKQDSRSSEPYKLHKVPPLRFQIGSDSAGRRLFRHEAACRPHSGAQWCGRRGHPFCCFFDNVSARVTHTSVRSPVNLLVYQAGL